MAAEQDAEKRKAAEWAMEIGRRRVAAYMEGEIPAELQAEWDEADEKVFSKIRRLLGLDEVESFLVGAAPTPPEVLEFFLAIGIEICETWGMSETSAMATLNPPAGCGSGRSARRSPNTEVKLAEDGEVMVRGPQVMKGYRNMPEKTAEAFTEDGWLLTGDVGEFDEEGYLRIVDRKKELIINAAGKNMSPANIEAKLKAASPLIAQAVAIGDRRPYNVALITLDPETLAARGAPAEDPAIAEEIAAAVEAGNERLSRVEQIKRHRIIPGEWAPGGEELTPTLKLKRRPIERKYEAEIRRSTLSGAIVDAASGDLKGSAVVVPPDSSRRSSARSRRGLGGAAAAAGGGARGAAGPRPDALRADPAGRLLQPGRGRDRPRPRVGLGARPRRRPRCRRSLAWWVATRVLRLRDRGPARWSARAQRQHRLPRLPADRGAARPRRALDRGALRRPGHRPLPAARRLRGRRRLRRRGRGEGPRERVRGLLHPQPAPLRGDRRPAGPGRARARHRRRPLAGAARRDPAARLLRGRRHPGRERRARRAADAAAAHPAGGAAVAPACSSRPALLFLLAAPLIDLPAAYLLLSAMPSGINSMVVAHAYGLDMEITAEAVAWSTAIVVAGALASLA